MSELDKVLAICLLPLSVGGVVVGLLMWFVFLRCVLFGQGCS
jgi:hypothetical protein